MSSLISGIHHVTAIASSAQNNIDFYAGFLGLRLVKKTINFDGPDVYHFYYGDNAGNPGTLITFFPYQGLITGRQGKGMLNTTAFSVSAGSVDFWMHRFQTFGIPYKEPQERFHGEMVVYFEDGDGLGLELVFNTTDQRSGYTCRDIPVEHAIKGIYNIEIWAEGYERTAGLLTEQLNHQLIAEQSNRFRFGVSNTPGQYIDILCSPDAMKGLAGSGTVHHLAFATADVETQLQVRAKIIDRGLDPTPVLDRKYFSSIYFREPGGVLFEVATAGPGFTIDESDSSLGQSLRLPPQFESQRSQIETSLPTIHLPTTD